MRTTIVTAGLLCCLAAPVLAQDVSGAQAAAQRFAAAMNGGDAATAASLFTDEAVVLPPGRDRLSGRAAIQPFLGRMATAVQNLQYTPEDVKPIADGVVRETGSFSFKLRRQSGRDVSGKYMMIWVRTGADWKIAADMWNRAPAEAGGAAGRGGANRAKAPALDVE